MKLYFNGRLVGTNEYTGGFSSITGGEYFFLGRDVTLSDKTVQGFDGDMDEVRVWSSARTAEQIGDAMNQRLKGDEDGLVALWNFDDGTAWDASPNGHDGTLVGNAVIYQHLFYHMGDGNVIIGHKTILEAA